MACAQRQCFGRAQGDLPAAEIAERREEAEKWEARLKEKAKAPASQGGLSRTSDAERSARDRAGALRLLSIMQRQQRSFVQLQDALAAQDARRRAS